MDLRGQERTILLKKEIDGFWGKRNCQAERLGCPFRAENFGDVLSRGRCPRLRLVEAFGLEIAKRSATCPFLTSGGYRSEATSPSSGGTVETVEMLGLESPG
jgi:hypothetical protein